MLISLLFLGGAASSALSHSFLRNFDGCPKMSLEVFMTVPTSLSQIMFEPWYICQDRHLGETIHQPKIMVFYAWVASCLDSRVA